MKTGHLYRHYKGGIYRFLFIGAHTETGEEFVIYQSTSGEPRNWHRPTNMFFDEVV